MMTIRNHGACRYAPIASACTGSFRVDSARVELHPGTPSPKEDSYTTYQACETIRIHIVEELKLLRAGYRYLLEREDDMEVVSESDNGLQACRDYVRYKPDVLVTGLSLPDVNGLEIIRNILDRYPDARILVVSMYSHALVCEATLQLGVRGFITKKRGARDLIMAIRKIMRGEQYVDPETATGLTRNKKGMGKPSLSSLTKRELEVCMFLADGQSVSGIAEQMHLSAKTIYTHRERILHKLGMKSVATLSQIAFLLDFFLNVQ